MTYKVYFEHLPEGSPSLYKSEGKKSYYIDYDSVSYKTHDHETDGDAFPIPLFEIHGPDPYCVLNKMFELFDKFDLIRGDEYHNIICAHKGFYAIRSGREEEFRINIGMASVDIDLGDEDENFSGKLKTQLSFTECVEIDMNDHEAVAVAQIMYA